MHLLIYCINLDSRWTHEYRTHITHLRQQCHNNSVTKTVLQQQCYSNSVTTTVSQKQRHNNSVTTVSQKVLQQCHKNSVTTTVLQKVSQKQCHNNSVTTSVTTTVSQQQCHNSKFVIFQEKLLKILKCYNFLWMQRRHNCSPAAFCKLRYDTIPVHVQALHSKPKNSNFAKFWVVTLLSQMSDIFDIFFPKYIRHLLFYFSESSQFPYCCEHSGNTPSFFRSTALYIRSYYPG